MTYHVFTGLMGLTLALVAAEALYLRVAGSFGIVDRPNARSSHNAPVVRGGGIVFPFAWFLFSIWNGLAFPWFTLGLLALSTVSFVDDLRPLPPAKRFMAQMLSVALCFTEAGIWGEWPLWALPIAFVLCIGTVNAFNFMDGINGITGMYALSVLLPLSFHLEPVGVGWGSAMSSPIPAMILSLLVFGFYNFRRRARCFAGDVGSVSIGFILVFIVLMVADGKGSGIGLRLPTSEGFGIKYVLLFAVYGVDSVFTIAHRLVLGEDIFEPHRKHLYQYLANEKGIPHLRVSLAYSLLQFAIGIVVVSLPFSVGEVAVFLSVLAVGYAAVKGRVLASLKGA